MRRAGVAAGAVVLLAGVVVFWTTTRPETSCRTTLTFRGTTYTSVPVQEEVLARDDLGTATVRGCGDRGPYKRDVAMSSMRGVAPRLAVVTPTDAGVVYLAAGVTLDELPAGLRTRVGS